MALSRITNYIEADGADLNLQSSDTTITASSVLGVINFKAPSEASGTDAILLASKIEAVAEGTFSASSNATKLSFSTASSEAASEKMSLSSAGLLTVSGRIITDDTTEATSTTDGSLQTDGGLSVAKDIVAGDDVKLLSDSAVLSFGADSEITLTHSADTGLILKNTNTGDDKPIVLTFQTGETDIQAGDVLGRIDFQAPDEGTGTDAILVAASIEALSEGDFSSSSNATMLSFKTGSSEAATEKFRIESSGSVGIAADGSTSTNHLRLGASADLKIYHDGSNSFIDEVGTGDLRIKGSTVRILTDQLNISNSANDEDMITAVADGAVNLRHNHVSCLTTTSDGGIDIEGGDIIFSTAGKGIVLVSTSNTDANTLADYEEGTFTWGSNANVSFQSSSNVGKYTKIGRMVYVQFWMDISSVSGTNHFYANSMPFLNGANTSSTINGNSIGSCSLYNVNFDDNATTTMPILDAGSSTVYFYHAKDNSNWDIMINSEMISTSEVGVTLAYMTDL